MGDHPDRLDTLLLLALPASGKSEIRRYLGSLGPDAADLHLGPLVDLDDYPYVHLMRRIAAESMRAGGPAVFFPAPDRPFVDPRDWLTLIHLLNEDHAVATDRTPAPDGPPSPAAVLDRLARARASSGAGPLGLAGPVRRTVQDAVAGDVAALALPPLRPPGGTIVVEFARGGPEGSTPPLPPPLGYQHSLARLDPAILATAAILYVAVDPHQSRRRNRERSIPGPEGDASILFHGVPEEVMRRDYGMDDFGWLLDRAEVPGTVTVEHATAGTFHVPAVAFDNRDDRTSFLRADPSAWPAPAVAALHRALSAALDALVVRL
jgi:hypothetical protein